MTDKDPLAGSLSPQDNTRTRSCELVQSGLTRHLVPIMGWHRGLPSLPCSHTRNPWYTNRPHHLLAGTWERASAETDIQALLFSSHLESQQSSWGSSTGLIPLQASRVALQWCHPGCPVGCGSACHTVLRLIHSCHCPTGNRSTHSRHRYSSWPSASVLHRCCRKRLDEFNTRCVLIL